MKKRKELDALLGSRAKRDSSGLYHAQQDQDFLSSLSSPDADTYVAPITNYGIPSKRVNRSTGSICSCTVRRMIRICLPACFLSLVAACITACIGIVWMQVQLKSDVDRLKDRIVKLETWQQVQPDSINDLKVAVTNMEKNLKEIKDGENGVRELNKQIFKIKKKVDDDHTLPRQSLELLQNEVEELKKTIVDLKSSMESVKSTAKTAQSSQQLLSGALDRLEQVVTSHKENIDSTINVKQLSDVNMLAEIKQMNSTIEKLTTSLGGVQGKLDELQEKVPTDDYKKNQEKVLVDMKDDIKLLKQDAQSKNQSFSRILKELAALSTVPESKPAIYQDDSGHDTTLNHLHAPASVISNNLEKQSKGNGKPHSKQARSVRDSNFASNQHDSGKKTIAKHEIPQTNLLNENNQPAVSMKGGILMRARMWSEEELLSVLQSRLLKSDRDKDKTLTKEEIEAEFGEKTWMVLHKLDNNHDGRLNISELSKNGHVSNNQNS